MFLITSTSYHRKSKNYSFQYDSKLSLKPILIIDFSSYEMLKSPNIANCEGNYVELEFFLNEELV